MYKFSHDEDPNDLYALHKRLAKLEIGKPETSGGYFHDDSNKNVVYEQFNIHTPPDVTQKTRIVAIPGINAAEAQPDEDGRLVSDFLAFWHLLPGLTDKCSMLS